MSPHHVRKLKIASTWAVIVIAGVGVGAWNFRSTAEEVRVQLLRGATRAAIAFDLAEVRRLTGEPEDVPAPAYRTVNARLRKFGAVDPRVRSRYLFRYYPDSGKVV
jgi:hypothetical protein